MFQDRLTLFLLHPGLSADGIYGLKTKAKLEALLKNGEEVSLHNFTEEFKRILKDIEKEVDFEKFISLWLKGPEEGFGFSKALHNHFFN